MKRLVFVLAVIGSIASGCSTDFDLTSDWKDITVVYGLLNTSDSAQYIKINKGFLDERTNALVLAQNPDSIFYDNIDVKLQEVDGAGTFNLEKVDGNVEGYEKAPGVFPTSPNYLYKTKSSLNPNKRYRLVITKDDGNAVTAETNIVSALQVVKPDNITPVNLVPTPNSFYAITWKTAKNAYFYGLRIRVYYEEFPAGEPSQAITKYFDWTVFSDYAPELATSNQTIEYRLYGDELYTEVVKHIQPIPGLWRKVKNMDFTFSAGGLELYTYYLVNQAKQGLTSGQIGPDYSNISNGKGVFSSRLNKVVSQVQVKASTMDSLACNSITKPLNFLNSQGQLCQ